MKNVEMIKLKTKEFWNSNKDTIIKCTKIGVGVIAIGTGTLLILDNRKKSEMIKDMTNLIILQNERIDELESLCKDKDSFVCNLMSKLLRKGVSEGGILMADRKQWLKQNKNVA